MVIVSASLRKQIESIKEIVGNHSDSDIYNALKECHMNLDEAVDKLLHQDTFHEVRKRRVKKEMNSQSTEYSNQVEPRKRNDYINQGQRLHSDRNGYINQGHRLHSDRIDYINQGQRLHSDRNGRRGGYTRRGISREFRVVRDNRVNQNSAREPVSSTQVTSSDAPRQVPNVRERSAYVGSNNQRRSGGQYFRNRNGGPDVRPKVVQSTNYNTRKEHPKENISSATITDSQVSVTKQQNEPVGVYASASDPVHVPTHDSRPAVGAIRREIGVVGGRRQSSESVPKQSHQQNVSGLNSVLRTSSATVQSAGITNTVPPKDQSHRNAVESGTVNSAGTRFGNTSHFSNRFSQQPAGQKGGLPSKEWKPKTTQKRSVPIHGVIGSTVKSSTDQTNTSKSAERETEELENKLTEINIHDTQKVIIAQSIRVPEFERFRLTFGTIDMESDIINNPSSEFQSADVTEEAVVVEPVEASPSNNHISDFDNQVRTSASTSPGEPSEDPSPINNDSAEASNTENYADKTLVHDNSSFTTSKSEQLQRSIESPNFSAYDPQPAYEMPYFRHSVDDAVRVPGIPSNQEALSSHTTNMIPNSSVAMMQQQQQQQQAQVAQMYPQLSHYTMPYRQFIPPMYVPPMVPGYSGNPGYPHLSNGNSYVLMPGGGSHVPGNGLKYEFQQFKPFPAGSPTGFGCLVSPTGYAINPPGVVGGPTGLDDSSRIKYKDNNLYVPNPQAETSGVWIQNHREHPGMQSTPYFNMQGQTGHPAAYMQSLATHPSFNTAASPQSSQMQFPGMYPPQASGIPNAHHLGGGNIGVGVAPPPPGPQVGGYQQQPQMNHLNWATTNF